MSLANCLYERNMDVGMDGWSHENKQSKDSGMSLKVV